MTIIPVERLLNTNFSQAELESDKTINAREVMPLEHHPLIKEFPELHDAIHELKTHDDHFRELFEEYEKLDKEIYRIESDSEPASDQYTEELKLRRVSLKDELYAMLKKATND